MRLQQCPQAKRAHRLAQHEDLMLRRLQRVRVFITIAILTDITIDKLERKDDKTFVVSGSFKGTELQPGVLAKELKGKTLATVSGRFDFSEVPIRQSGM